MKRFLSTVILSFLAIACIPALSYEPSINITAGIRGSHIDEWYLHTSTLVSIETELPTMSFEYGGRVSLPIGLTLSSRTAEYDGLSIHGYLEGYAGFSYTQEITSTFSMSSSLKFNYRFYETIDASIIGGSVELGLIYMPHPNIGIVIPLEMSFLKGEMDYSISVGSRFMFGGSR